MAERRNSANLQGNSKPNLADPRRLSYHARHERTCERLPPRLPRHLQPHRHRGAREDRQDPRLAGQSLHRGGDLHQGRRLVSRVGARARAPADPAAPHRRQGRGTLRAGLLGRGARHHPRARDRRHRGTRAAGGAAAELRGAARHARRTPRWTCASSTSWAPRCWTASRSAAASAPRPGSAPSAPRPASRPSRCAHSKLVDRVGQQRHVVEPPPHADPQRGPPRRGQARGGGSQAHQGRRAGGHARRAPARHRRGAGLGARRGAGAAGRASTARSSSGT